MMPLLGGVIIIFPLRHPSPDHPTFDFDMLIKVSRSSWLHNVYTVDLLIFACLDFREFVILEIFAKSKIRDYRFR